MLQFLDARGMANGNDGPFKEEAAYFGTKEKPVEPGATDADVIWRFDMLDGLGVPSTPGAQRAFKADLVDTVTRLLGETG